MNKKIGIFILNYNGINWLKQTLPNLIKYSKKAEIIIIDNNSTDNSIQYLETHFPSIELKINIQNYGFAKGYNDILLKEKRFKYFIIMNNDVKVSKNWIVPLLKIMQNKDVGIVQPKIKSLQNPNYFDYAGAAGGYIDCFGIPFCRGRIFNNIELDTGQYDDDTTIFWASGACFMIKAKLFQKLNGFDEIFFMHQEEIDLCWRAQNLNKKSYFAGKSTVYHFGGGTLEYKSPIKAYYNHRNNLLLLIKNLNSRFIFIMFCRILLDYILILGYIFSGFFYLKNVFYILKAHGSLLLLLPKFLKSRKPNKSNLIYNGSIIFDYYIKGRKKFSQLK
ncbi:MAG: dTDP-Rha--alpha-D-GlcNAc-pyrophosphate polyprenol alpha-3-L-rhamnosyltransferase [Flavobacteriales bacterium]|nr:dTDP-Rha--alpha-D-GlcNAc-pyrophosphate polyprenol alpha-3-L-rhamnosyltransferase [Flavobacteriales bacterium]